MNLQNLKQILNSNIPLHAQEQLVLKEIAQDESAIPQILELLNYEREENKELISDLNVLLSKAETGLEIPSLNRDNFMNKEILDFYNSHSDSNKVFHCFKARNYKFKIKTKKV